MRWFEWLGIAFSVSILGHIVIAEWAHRFVKKLDQDPSAWKKFLSSYPKVRAYEYAASVLNSSTPQQFLKMGLAVLWIPLLLVFLLLAGIVLGLEWTHLKVILYLDRRRYNRMTPEQKREHSIEAEKKLLAMASEVRLDPHAMESNHPLHTDYREMMLTGERIALKMREAREKREQSLPD